MVMGDHDRDLRDWGLILAPFNYPPQAFIFRWTTICRVGLEYDSRCFEMLLVVNQFENVHMLLSSHLAAV